MAALTWLLTVTLAVAVVASARAAVRPGGVELNHVVLFTFGLLFYWVLPVLAGLARPLSNEPGLALWYATWDAAESAGVLTSFTAFTLIVYVAFLAGDRLGTRLKLAPVGEVQELAHDPRVLGLFLPPAIALFLAYAWVLRSQLFVGYLYTASPVLGSRGTLSATSILLLVLYLLRDSEAERWPRRPGWVPVLLDPFLLAYIASAILVLSLGGRLYVVSAVLMALVLRTVYGRPLPLARVLAMGVVAVSLVAVAGTIRLGASPSLLASAYNILAEPLFTSFSLLDFIAQHDAPLVAFPRFLLGDFVNLIPTSILPNKAQLLLDPADYGYTIFAPLGALNSYVSLVINFGLLGTVGVVFGLGAGLAVLKRRGTALARVSYAMLSGWLAFTFFRDEFSISVVKNMFEFSVLVPLLLLWMSHVITVIAPRREDVMTAPADARPWT